MCQPVHGAVRLTKVRSDVSCQVDRLVNQSYQDWAHRIYEAIYVQTPGHLKQTPDYEPAHRILPTTVR